MNTIINISTYVSKWLEVSPKMDMKYLIWFTSVYALDAKVNEHMFALGLSSSKKVVVNICIPLDCFVNNVISIFFPVRADLLLR